MKKKAFQMQSIYCSHKTMRQAILDPKVKTSRRAFATDYLKVLLVRTEFFRYRHYHVSTRLLNSTF